MILKKIKLNCNARHIWSQTREALTVTRSSDRFHLRQPSGGGEGALAGGCPGHAARSPGSSPPAGDPDPRSALPTPHAVGRPQPPRARAWGAGRWRPGHMVQLGPPCRGLRGMEKKGRGAHTLSSRTASAAVRPRLGRNGPEPLRPFCGSWNSGHIRPQAREAPHAAGTQDFTLGKRVKANRLALNQLHQDLCSPFPGMSTPRMLRGQGSAVLPLDRVWARGLLCCSVGAEWGQPQKAESSVKVWLGAGLRN